MPTLFRQLNSDRCFPESKKCDDEPTRGTGYAYSAEVETEIDVVTGEEQILPEELPPELQQPLIDLMEDAAALGTGIYSRVFPLPRSNQQWIRIRITACQRNPSRQNLEISRLTADELLRQLHNRQTDALARLRNLSHREQHVLQLVAAGFPNKASPFVSNSAPRPLKNIAAMP